MQLSKWLCLAGMLAVTVPLQAAEECLPATPVAFGGVAASVDGVLRRPEVNLALPGRHCLMQDLRQAKLLNPRTGAEMKTIGGDAIVLIGADDVSLDLGGHTIANDRELGYTLVRHDRYEPGRGHSHAFARTRVGNGRLLSPGSRGIGIRLVSTGPYGSAAFGAPVPLSAGRMPVNVFPDTAHRVEDLVIEAGSRAILIDGRNNIIRNNRITLQGITAIVAQGPGVVIENNLIDVRADLRGWSEHDRRREAQAPFVIRLVQADGAVVRNNRVRLLHAAAPEPLPAAVELVASRDVVVEENRFEGMRAAVSADAASSYREIGNVLEACGVRATRFIAPDETGDSAVASVPACRRSGSRGATGR
jgi:hypothetical protein